jgi:hypothetical protein
MMLEHNTPIEISNPTVRSYWIQHYRSVCRIVSRIPIGFLSDHWIVGRFRSVLYRISSDPISDWINWVAAAKQLLFGSFSLVEYDGKEKTRLCDEDMNERKKEKEKIFFQSSLQHKIKTCSFIRSSYASKNIVRKKV